MADLLANFRVQIAIGLLPMLAVIALAKQWKWLMIGIGFLVLNSWTIVPYVIPTLGGDTTTSTQPYRLLTSNVLTSNHQHQRLIELVRAEQPDIVVVLEINADWARDLEQLAGEYQYRHLDPREHNFGIGILSKIPFTAVETKLYGAIELPWIKTKFDLEDKSVELFAVHPVPPMGARHSKMRNDEMMEVSSLFDPSTSRIMTGDFNMPPWSPWFARVTSNSQTVDAARGFGPTRTWEVFPTIVGGLKIDHALLSDDFQVHDFRVGPDIGSDHRPIIVDFSFRNK